MVCLQNRKPAVHPWVNIALHRNEFRLVELLLNIWRARWLRLIPLAVYFGQRMDVMRCLVCVHNLQFLAGMQRDYVRGVLTALLSKGHSLRRGIGVIRPCRNVDNDVLQRVVRTGHHCLGCYRRVVLLGATRLLRHVDRLLFDRSAGIGHFATDRAAKQQRWTERRNQHRNAELTRTHGLTSWVEIGSSFRHPQFYSQTDWLALLNYSGSPGEWMGSRCMEEFFHPPPSIPRSLCYDVSPATCAGNEPDPTRRWAESHPRTTASEFHPPQ